MLCSINGLLIHLHPTDCPFYAMTLLRKAFAVSISSTHQAQEHCTKSLMRIVIKTSKNNKKQKQKQSNKKDNHKANTGSNHNNQWHLFDIVPHVARRLADVQPEATERITNKATTKTYSQKQQRELQTRQPLRHTNALRSSRQKVSPLQSQQQATIAPMITGQAPELTTHSKCKTHIHGANKRTHNNFKISKHRTKSDHTHQLQCNNTQLNDVITTDMLRHCCQNNTNNSSHNKKEVTRTPPQD